MKRGSKKTPLHKAIERKKWKAAMLRKNEENENNFVPKTILRKKVSK